MTRAPELSHTRPMGTNSRPRRRNAAVVASVLAATGAVVGVGFAALPLQAAKVRSVYDGDTLSTTDGLRVRLLQIDTPELGTGECYSRAAHRVLLSLVPTGSRIALEADPALDRVDRYGRLLRYVHRGTLNVNVELVRRGAALPYFYGGDRGRYASVLLRSARAARAARRGLWGACPRAVLDPTRAADTGVSGPPASPPPVTTETALPAASPSPVAASAGSCAPSYSTVCIPPPPPDLDCRDVSARAFPVRWDVADPDPHRFDGDRDGVGCES